MSRAILLSGAVLLALATVACGGGSEGGDQSSNTAGGTVQIEGAPLSQQAQASGVVALAPHVIVDRVGWGEPMPQSRILVPVGWTVQSDVLWHGQSPTCGAARAEPVVRMTSPDGRSTIEIASSMLVTSTRRMSDGSPVPPEMQGVMQAQEAQLQSAMAQMEQDFRRRGDGCHAGTANSAQEIAQRYLLPWRRRDARVVAMRPLPQTREPLEAMVRSTVSQLPVQGMQHYTDAISIDLERPDGAVERVNFGVVASRHTIPGLTMIGNVRTPSTVFDSINTTPIVSMRAPREQFAAVERLATTVLASMSTNPQWREALNQLEQELARIRAEGSRQTLIEMGRRGEIAAAARMRAGEESLRAWNAGQESRQRSHDAFIDRIYDSTGFVNPQTGQRTRVPYGQQAFSNGQGGVAVGPEGSSPGAGWTPMQPAQTF